MLKGLKHMLGFRTAPRTKPDPIAADVAIAAKRNEFAGERAREAIKELLEANDGNKQGSRR